MVPAPNTGNESQPLGLCQHTPGIHSIIYRSMSKSLRDFSNLDII